MKRYKNLIGLLLVIMLAVALFNLGVSSPVCFALVACWQLIQFARSRRPGYCFTTALSPEQLKEWDDLMKGMKSYDSIFKELAGDAGWAKIKQLPDLLKTEQTRNDELAAEVKKLKKQLLLRRGDTGVRWVRGVPFVTDECALAFTGIYIACCFRQDKWDAKRLGEPEGALAKACDYLGVTKAALTSADIPLPTIYVPQVVELVYQYGQYRQYATVFPLGAGTVNLPQLKVGEDAFGLIATSGGVTERKVAATNVTHTAQKVGGIVRIPTEIEEDTFIPLGQFLARYIARRFAHFEDMMGFLGDNTATYNRYGVGPYVAAAANTPQLQLLANGKTKPTDAVLNDFRVMRAKVNPAVFQTGNGAYYMNPTMDALLCTFNTIGSPQIYVRGQGGAPATLDGFPIRWVGVMQPYVETATASAFLALFGDLSYWFLDERGAPRVETSREVYFATDEIGMRALERIDVEAMAPDAMAALQLAAQ